MIDQQMGLVFKTEQDLFQYFDKFIDHFEVQHQKFLTETGETEETMPDDSLLADVSEDLLDATLDEPTEIWHDEKTFSEFPVFYFIKAFEEKNAFYVAVTFVSSDDEPTFIFLHFLTQNLDLVQRYRHEVLIFDRMYEELDFAALDGDAITEGDPLAMGLFLAMLKLRGENDVKFEDFKKLGEELREDCIESADEIWRSTDSKGQSFVTFIKEATDHEVKDLTYLAVTLEDPGSNMHTWLFSFPTTDEQLVDRYRHGENMQAEDVTHESSH